MSALLDLGDLVADMDDTVRILMHLADSRAHVSANEWGKLGRDLHDGLCKIKELAAADVEESQAIKEAHKAALAAARAEKAAPGSKEDGERAEALWTLLRSLVGVASEQCTNAGYPPRPPTAPSFREETQS
jgi:hypothetical protein